MAGLHIIDHPLVQHKVSLLRDKNTGTKEFRELVAEIAMFICYEATRDLPLKEIELETLPEDMPAEIGEQISLEEEQSREAEEDEEDEDDL